MPLSPPVNAGGLTIGGVAMSCPAWVVHNLQELWLPAVQRGNDRIRPGVAGVKPAIMRDTVTRRTLQLLIVGDCDRTGTPVTNLLQGLQANIDYLIANVVAPTGLTDGTRSAVLTMPDATTRTEPVHVTGMDFGQIRADGAWVKATIDLSIPTGRII